MNHLCLTFALLRRNKGGDGYERCAKIREWKMIIDAKLEERRQRVH
jgi:hypothetical protein